MRSITMTMAMVAALGMLAAAANAQEMKLTPAVKAKYTAGDIHSGYLYTKPETRKMQDDDFINPSFLWIEQGEQLWSKVEGKAGKSCATCHQDAKKSMKGVATTYPKYNAAKGKVITLEQRIDICLVDNMQAKPVKYDSGPSLALSSYVSLQSRGMPINVSIDGPAKAVYDKGKTFYETRRGLLDMACANCHVDNAGKHIRADLLSQGQPNGFPTYRLKWQKLGSLHRRFRGCNEQVRSERFRQGSPEYVALELYLKHRANGLKMEAPSVRR